MTEQEVSEAQERLDAIVFDIPPSVGSWTATESPKSATSQEEHRNNISLWLCGQFTGNDARFIAHAPDDLRKALAALQRVRTALIVNSYEMNSWSKAVSVDDIITALNGTEAKL